MAETAFNGPMGSTPVPDPTTLTTENLRREISGLRELLEGKIDGRVHTVDTRLDGMDKALVLLQAIEDRLPDQMDRRVLQLDSVVSQRFVTLQEQFRGVQTQFEEREVRARETATLLQTALAAALQAQKEAAGEQVKTFKESIDKSERGATKEIDGLGDLLRSITKSTEDKISDLKDRVGAIEGLGIGRNAGITDQRSNAGEVRAYVALGFSAVLLVLAVISLVLTH